MSTIPATKNARSEGVVDAVNGDSFLAIAKLKKLCVQMRQAKRNLTSVNQTIDGSHQVVKQLTQLLIKEVPKKDTESSLMPKIRLLLRENKENKENVVALRPFFLHTCDVLLKKYHQLADAARKPNITTIAPELVTKILKCLGNLGSEGATTLADAVPKVSMQWFKLQEMIGTECTEKKVGHGHRSKRSSRRSSTHFATSEFEQVPEHELVAMLEGAAPDLLHADLTYNESFEDGIGFEVFERFLKLETIILKCCHNIKASAVNKITSACPQLKVLSLECVGFNDVGYASMIETLSEACPLLADLQLEGRVYSGYLTRDSPELQFQESIAACLKLASRCTHLESLTVPGFGSDALSEQLALHCPNLKVLSLGDSSLSVDSIIQLAIGCPQLYSIWNVGIGQLLAQAILEHNVSFAHLEEFSLPKYKGDNGDGYTDRDLSTLGSNLPKLAGLNVESAHFTPASILTIGSAFKQLTSLTLEPIAVSPELAAAFRDGELCALKFLNLKRCSIADATSCTREDVISIITAANKGYKASPAFGTRYGNSGPIVDCTFRISKKKATPKKKDGKAA